MTPDLATNSDAETNNSDFEEKIKNLNSKVKQATCR